MQSTFRGRNLLPAGSEAFRNLPPAGSAVPGMLLLTLLRLKKTNLLLDIHKSMEYYLLVSYEQMNI